MGVSYSNAWLIRQVNHSVFAAKSPNLTSTKCTTPTVYVKYALAQDMTQGM